MHPISVPYAVHFVQSISLWEDLFEENRPTRRWFKGRRSFGAKSQEWSQNEGGTLRKYRKGLLGRRVVLNVTGSVEGPGGGTNRTPCRVGQPPTRVRRYQEGGKQSAR